MAESDPQALLDRLSGRAGHAGMIDVGAATDLAARAAGIGAGASGLVGRLMARGDASASPVAQAELVLAEPLLDAGSSAEASGAAPITRARLAATASPRRAASVAAGSGDAVSPIPSGDIAAAGSASMSQAMPLTAAGSAGAAPAAPRPLVASAASALQMLAPQSGLASAYANVASAVGVPAMTSGNGDEAVRMDLARGASSPSATALAGASTASAYDSPMSVPVAGAGSQPASTGSAAAAWTASPASDVVDVASAATANADLTDRLVREIEQRLRIERERHGMPAWKG